ncbi:TetR family transcriptional regulator [Nocardioides sp. Kera G14]|uniref:TetR family transcriptional regulator n=1 Tax=Nocardioides sp. Kera G14 TaxID=2884264 RepID=UPI001D10ED00|nr:TetR family transcriptional regulator [Nocardioides sp. Kera G14]UDY23998.1 TetR family transcriptional regulator [Nocardioides sp. Kera G14]
MSETKVSGATRAESKERTRRAILDATLRLTDGVPLPAVSLRQIAKEVGIVPTAFYRHFATMDELGLTLVDESFVSLRAMLREIRSPASLASPVHVADASVDVIASHVALHRGHFGFISRERNGASGPVREAIRHELELSELELATDLARLAGLNSWPAEDLRALSGLIVTAMVDTVDELMDARHEQEPAIIATARIRLRMLVIAALNWKPSA